MAPGVVVPRLVVVSMLNRQGPAPGVLTQLPAGALTDNVIGAILTNASLAAMDIADSAAGATVAPLLEEVELGVFEWTEKEVGVLVPPTERLKRVVLMAPPELRRRLGCGPWPGPLLRGVAQILESHGGTVRVEANGLRAVGASLVEVALPVV